MGFWHTGYLEFHEPAAEADLVSWEPLPPTYPCMVCGVEFSSEADLHIHTFEGHPTDQPVLVLNGRQCGRRRMTLTHQTGSADWVIENADAAWVNKQPTSVADVVQRLIETGNGVVDVTLGNGQVRSDFQFEFALAKKRDLEGVDSALEELVRGTVLNEEAVDAFIMRSRRYATAGRYCSALADYLYGAASREKDGEVVRTESTAGRGAYQDRFDSAVHILGTFDRPSAEAICGIVAFHYNQFGLAMTKTRSQRVAQVSMRFHAMLRGERWDRGDLAPIPHASLDYALSDGVTEQVLKWSSMAIDGTASSSAVEDMVEAVGGQHPLDQFKLRLIAAEHFLAVGDRLNAMKHADPIRYGAAERWYPDFWGRLQRGMQQ